MSGNSCLFWFYAAMAPVKGVLTPDFVSGGLIALVTPLPSDRMLIVLQCRKDVAYEPICQQALLQSVQGDHR